MVCRVLATGTWNPRRCRMAPAAHHTAAYPIALTIICSSVNSSVMPKTSAPLMNSLTARLGSARQPATRPAARASPAGGNQTDRGPNTPSSRPATASAT